MSEQAETTPQLIFDWSKPRRPIARLVLWLLVTSVGLTLFFMLFHVIYQTPRRIIPATHQVTLLSPNDPAARNLLQRVSDKDFFIFSGNGSGQHQLSLAEQAPVFHPTFEKHELKLQDLPQRDTKPPPARLLDVTEPTLPPPDLKDLHSSVAATTSAAPPASVLTLQISGALENRKLLSQLNLSTLPPLDYTAWRFQIGVAADGRVTFVLPVASGEKSADAAPVLHLLNHLRFAPDEKTPAPVWGIAKFEWVHPSAAP
jgi:hypothetical protein